MSEANIPFDPASQSQAASTDSDSTRVLKGDASSMPEHQPESAAHPQEAVSDLGQIFDASELEDLTFDTPQAANRSSIAAWLQEPNQPQPEAAQPALATAPESPNLSDLVNLIQELNQCNSLLMQRVAQLEEALEHSQNALQDEVGRAQGDGEQDWATVQEQVTNLFNQLEFAHQTNQRQQILTETLTGQLENSQERVAELEREAALLQQRYNEQTQLLVKAEHTSRDLQSRLQRQQRYTLQFKAALEKSLEVPTPQYEVGLSLEPEPSASLEATPAAEVLFLPRAKQIQPWSAQTHASKAQPLSKSPWMKFQNQPIAAGSTGDASAALPAPKLDSELLSASESSPTTSPAPINQLDLPSFGLPLLQVTPASPADPAADAIPDLDLAAADPALKQQLDQVVKPLADLLAEALLNEAQAQPKAQPAHSKPPNPTVWQKAEAEPTHSNGGFNLTSTDDGNADQLLASVMAEAEDALWQDLARLIDVSAEDVVKASLSGDLAAFETLDFDAVQAVNEPQTVAQPAAQSVAQSAAQSNQLTPAESPSSAPANAVTVAPLLRRLSQQVAAHSAAAEPVEADLTADEASSLTPASWPSPVVYPLRPVKKRQSLAMVDLPSFPKG